MNTILTAIILNCPCAEFCISILQVNILGTCVCTREFVKQLKERNVDDGQIFLLNR